MFIFLLACSTSPSIEYFSLAVEAFTLQDVNSTSTSFEMDVSTSDFPEQISAWYFGHST
jgi:hypothetical protein